jgi:hypothetical protein
VHTSADTRQHRLSTSTRKILPLFFVIAFCADIAENTADIVVVVIIIRRPAVEWYTAQDGPPRQQKYEKCSPAAAKIRQRQGSRSTLRRRARAS